MNQVSSRLHSVSGSNNTRERHRENLFKSIPEAAVWSSRDIDDLLERTRKVEVPGDTILMEPNTVCNSFMVLLEGSVRVYQNVSDGREITLYRIKPGDVCVMSLDSLLKDQHFNAVARSEAPVHAISLSKKQFLALIARHESFAIRVMSSLTSHFCKTLGLMEDLVFNRLESRLACLLGSLFEANDGGAIKTTHQELANELGTTREVVSRILKNLEQKGCLALSRGKISLAAENSPAWFSRNRQS